MKKLIEKVYDYEVTAKYYADSEGHIWSEKHQRYLSERQDKDGYYKVVLQTNKGPKHFSVHRLILTVFQPVSIDIQRTHMVDHINRTRTDNRLENLRWATPSENALNRATRYQSGVANTSSNFTKEKLLLLIEDINSGNYTRKELLMKYNFSRSALERMLCGQSYQDNLEGIEIKPNFRNDYKRDTKGEKNGRAKLDNEKVLEIVRLIKSKQYSYSQIGEMYGVSATAISGIKNKKTWKHLTKNITFD